MNNIIADLANTLQCGFRKIAELNQASKVAAAPATAASSWPFPTGIKP